MIAMLLFAFLSTQTLAPPPINFDVVRVPTEGGVYIMRNQNNRISIEKEEPWIERAKKNHLMHHLANYYQKPPIGRGFDDFNPQCCAAWSFILVVMILFMTVVGFAGWKWWVVGS